MTFDNISNYGYAAVDKIYLKITAKMPNYINIVSAALIWRSVAIYQNGAEP